jgi:Ca2+:H+ antiporter
VSLESSVAFQLFTHPHLYADGDADPDDVNVREGRAIPLMKRPAKSVAKERRAEEGLDEEEEEEELPQLNVWVALGLLVVVTVLVARDLAKLSSEAACPGS